LEIKHQFKLNIRKPNVICVYILILGTFLLSGCGVSDKPIKNGLQHSNQANSSSTQILNNASGANTFNHIGAVTGISDDTKKGLKKTSFGTAGESTSAEFRRKCNNGVMYIETQDYGKALQVFEEILKEFPNSEEESSIAEYCIAEIHFRNKNNQMALESFQKIVQKYPNSPAAQNARAGIEYLQNFDRHEKDYVSPDVEDRNRRGR